MKKATYLNKKYSRLTSLSTHFIYICLKTVFIIPFFFTLPYIYIYIYYIVSYVLLTLLGKREKCSDNSQCQELLSTEILSFYYYAFFQTFCTPFTQSQVRHWLLSSIYSLIFFWFLLVCVLIFFFYLVPSISFFLDSASACILGIHHPPESCQP